MAPTAPQQTEVVLVPVPSEHLSSVYSLLASLMTPRGASVHPQERACPHCHSTAYLGSVDGGYQCEECGLTFQVPGLSEREDEIEVDHENGCWTEKMILRLAAELGASPAGRALDAVARRAPEVVTSDDLAASLDVDFYALRAELAVLSKTSRKLFGRRIWPMSARQGWGDGSRMGYRMQEVVARWWLRARPSTTAQAD